MISIKLFARVPLLFGLSVNDFSVFCQKLRIRGHETPFFKGIRCREGQLPHELLTCPNRDLGLYDQSNGLALLPIPRIRNFWQKIAF